MKLFEPFKNLDFSKQNCFLCGKIISPNLSGGERNQIPVFPDWFMNRFGLNQKPFRLLNESFTTYENLLIPCCEDCLTQYINPLENQIGLAFQKGYSGMRDLNPSIIFNWVSRILYGIIYTEIFTAIEDHEKENVGKGNDSEPLAISPSLLIKFSQVHLLLQSIRIPIEFEDFLPFSLWLIPLHEQGNSIPFEYRDDMSTLIFSLTAEDFGLIICLQDNQMNSLYHQDLMNKWGKKIMSFRQFQELRARIFYSAFLFLPIPDYLVLPPVEGEPNYTIIAQPLPVGGKKALFKPWNNATYAQVLEAFWKPWGISKKEILQDPENPLSVLEAV